jgi:hypothetical protein
MIAQNKIRELEILTYAVKTPDFDNSDMWFTTWVARNRIALDAYFDVLGVLPEEEYVVTKIQYERQQEIIAAAEHLNPTYREMQEELYQLGYDDEQYQDSKFSIYDADTGIPCIGEI